MCLPQFHVPMTIIYTHDDGTRDVFLRQEELGHGGFAVVYRVTHETTNKSYAMKVISKDKYEGPRGKKKLEKLKNEIIIQKSLDHPNIVRSYYAFSDAFNYYIVLEYCPGGTVRDFVKNSEKGYLSEPETRKILRDVVRGVVYLHDNRILHRDLKLENYMVGADGKIKIADFGLSVVLKNDDDKRFTICGTPNYLSPELLSKVNKGHSYELDIWTIGVSAFAMLTGRPPFDGGRKILTYENIKHCDYRFPPNIQISETAKDFIRIILRANPQKRPTAIDLANHPFLMAYDPRPVPPFEPLNEVKDDVHSPASYKSPLYNDQNFNANANFQIESHAMRVPLHGLPITPKDNFINNNYKAKNVNSPLFPRINDCETRSTKSHHRHIDLHHQNVHQSHNNNKVNDFNLGLLNVKKDFNIPKQFVSRFCFHGDDLGYLLADGTVGACFQDRSRVVMEPRETFVQFYRNYDSLPEVINLRDYIEKQRERLNENDRLHRKIALIQRFARSLKKTKSLYELPNDEYDSIIPLLHVKYFLNKNNEILFRLSDKNLQVNFSDHMKLIIFWSTKQMCLVRSIRERCELQDLNEIVNMNPHSDELKRFMTAKEMLSELCRK